MVLFFWSRQKLIFWKFDISRVTKEEERKLASIIFKSKLKKLSWHKEYQEDRCPGGKLILNFTFCRRKL